MNTGHDMTIRPAAPADVPLILSLIRELAEYERDPGAVVATPELLREHLFGPTPRAHCVIGELDGRPEGFALYFFNFSTWMGRPGLYLEDLFVRPECRGRGLGKALFLHLARLAHGMGCGRMEWSVLDWNTPAIEFYRSMGAISMDEWTVFRLTRESLAKLAGPQEHESSHG
ncbi:MAG: GNAT family N-acetyltransferase [Phycisphaeraceae bacterium]|nr:GNAT family N-acetyltransferase [Phycisphaeraceae bacterium]